MCGLAGVFGSEHSFNLVLSMLEKLEYRGYDSCGIYNSNGTLVKTTEHVNNLIDSVIFDNNINGVPDGISSIGHTRWATHGEVSIENAHPVKCGDTYVVHNGTLSPFNLETSLLSSDTHEIALQIDSYLSLNFLTSKRSFVNGLSKLKQKYKQIGSFLCMGLGDNNICAYCEENHPLYLGFYKDMTFISSDIDAFPINVDSIEYMLPGTSICISHKNIEILEGRLESIEKVSREKYVKKEDDYMLNEIKQQVDLVKNYKPNFEPFPFGEERHNIVGCGSSYYAGMYGAYLMRDSEVDCTVDYASEARFFPSNAVNLFVTQSGQTKDVIKAINRAKDLKARRYLVHNNENCQIKNEVDQSFYVGAGEEIGVAATKTFMMTSLFFYSWVYGKSSQTEILSSCIDKVIRCSPEIQKLAQKVCEYSNAIFLGEGNFYPIALEGALKMKEIAYIHSEGMPAAEIKHGPIALIDDKTISIVIKGYKSTEIENNINQIRSRGGDVIVFGDVNDENFDFRLPFLNCCYFLRPLVALVFVQLLAYHCAKIKGLDVDRPRSLSKVITV